jgi:integral membrane protein (TIGR01906 family)
MSVEKPHRPFLLGLLVRVLQLVVITALPLVLVLANARALMNDAFLTWEYTRPNFPADVFGFTTHDRLTYAPLALAYLFNDRGTDFLADQKQADGTPVYNERELSHMDDVKRVTLGLTRFGLALIGLFVVCFVVLLLQPGARLDLFQALLWGAVLTIILIVVGLIATVTSFEWLFTEFHRLFFVGNTWLFPTSDTLIRLFPEPLWIDAFALMFGGAILEAIILGAIAWRVTRRKPGASEA